MWIPVYDHQQIWVPVTGRKRSNNINIHLGKPFAGGRIYFIQWGFILPLYVRSGFTFKYSPAHCATLFFIPIQTIHSSHHIWCSIKLTCTIHDFVVELKKFYLPTQHFYIFNFSVILASNMKAIERWSVITLKRQATKKWLHLRTASTIAAASFSTLECWSLLLVRDLEKNATGRLFWFRVAESATLWSISLYNKLFFFVNDPQRDLRQFWLQKFKGFQSTAC